MSFLSTQCDCSEYWGSPQDYVRTIESLAIWLSIGLFALLGYIVNNFRRGLIGFLLAETIAFVSTSPLLLMIQSSPPTRPSGVSELARSQSFDALDPRILSSSGLAPVFVVGLILLLSLAGIVALFVGSSLRESRDSPEEVRMNWQFVTVGQLLNSVAVFWSVPATFLGYAGENLMISLGFNFSPLFGSWALLIMSALIVASLFLTIYGLRSQSTSSIAYAGLISIGSFVIIVCSIIALGYEAPLATAQPGPCYMSASSCEIFRANLISQTQNFLVMTFLLIGSLAVSGLIFSKVTIFLRGNRGGNL